MPYRKVRPERVETPRGAVYLLHFDAPVGANRPGTVTQHYIGFSRDPVKRHEAHRLKRGSRLARVAMERGIGFVVAALFHNATLAYEYQLKNRGGAAKWCPVCRNRPPIEETLP